MASVMEPLTDGRTGKPFEARRPLTFLPEPEVRTLVCPVVSVDDHVVEPLSLFDGRIAAKHREDAPAPYVDADGVPYWVIDGATFGITMREGPFGHPGSEWSWQPMRFD